MEKKRKKTRRLLGLTVGEISAMVALIISVIGLVISGVRYFDAKFASIDQRFQGIDRRFDGIDVRLNRIEIELKQTSNLVNTYLTWRFLYLHDPNRKDLVPRYDPNTRTLELVQKERRGK